METVTSKAGQARWNNAETHAVENGGKTETHALDVELKNNPTPSGRAVTICWFYES
jgi:hypothetical protein